MTLQTLPEKVGVSRQTVIALQACDRISSLTLALRIAQSFGVAVGEVF